MRGRKPKIKEQNERDIKLERTKLTQASMDTSYKQGTLNGNKRKTMGGVRQEQKEQEKSGQKKVILSWEFG